MTNASVIRARVDKILASSPRMTFDEIVALLDGISAAALLSVLYPGEVDQLTFIMRMAQKQIPPSSSPPPSVL